MPNPTPVDFADYCIQFPEATQERLRELRALIMQAEPGLTESIAYGMPAFNLDGTYLVYISGNKSHLGLYGITSGLEKFKDELAPYRHARGTLRFDLGQPLPRDLITRLIRHRVSERRV
ncbi:MAG: hypothetical protein TR69_WS6001000546 [candidate division WS6 bacterium OLB20]|uniref:YdhG-like domain-containing protein n=1 Tax=candidate division WS6 bacterium OLB20 TaxID=1617426 RepID=A0A136LY17_9BACT|nr:MAG: hypothetical protein TR69_WS6001000546 [candidate division WS6 bacterium OLB20]